MSWHAGVAHGPGEVVGLQDEVAGAAIGAEQGRQRLIEQAKVAQVSALRRQRELSPTIPAAYGSGLR